MSQKSKRSLSPSRETGVQPVPSPRQSAIRNPQYVIRSHSGLILALLAYLILAFSYFFIVPIFEAPDEWTHTGHIKHIAEGNGLPVMLPGQGIWGGQQPPLYYAVGALLVQPFDLNGFETYLANRTNPHASIGYALDPGNKNVYLHRPSESFPYSGLSLTVHILRLYSMGFGLITVIFAYLTAYELVARGRGQGAGRREQKARNTPRASPTPYALLSAAHLFATAVALFVACQPMFAFITASVHNEPATIAFSTVGLWLSQRYVLHGPSPHPNRAVALGVVLGLTALSKMTGLSLGLVVAVAFLQSALASRRQPGAARLLWRDGLLIGLLFLLVAGWWYWRNYRLYGDFFQRGLYEIYFNQQPQPLTLRDFLYHLSIGEVSFWATFGWLNIVAPEWVYSFYRIASRVGLLGAAIAGIGWLIQKWGRRTPHLPHLLIHLLFPPTVAFSLTRLVATEGGLQGRQLLPALASIAIVIIGGWWMLTPARGRRPVLALLATAFLGVALWLPYRVVVPAYYPAPLLAEADLPAELPRLDWVYNDEIKLVGAEIGRDIVWPGQRVPVTAYWQALKPMETNYSLFVHLVGRDGQSAGQFNSYPGLGLRPTSGLQPGQIVADTYPVLVNGGSPAPARLQVKLGLFDFDEPGRPGIQPAAPDGNPASPVVEQLKLVPNQWPSGPDRPPLAEFADHIRLVDYSLENCNPASAVCTVTLTWQATGRPALDYTVFIQLWRNGQRVAGFDAPPLDNNYPTGLWAAGEVIVDPHRLALSAVPPGEYRLLAGLYHLPTGERLAASAAGGESLPNYAVDLGMITVE